MTLGETKKGEKRICVCFDLWHTLHKSELDDINTTSPHPTPHTTMQLNITSLTKFDLFAFSHSVAEGGENAAQNTWCNAKEAGTRFLDTEGKVEAFLDFVSGYGAWDEGERAAWTAEEREALLLQFIAGDVRDAGADSLDELDWDEYHGGSETGRYSRRLWRDDDGTIWYYIGY